MSDFDAMDEILREFLVESYENLDSLDTDLIVLEEDPSSEDILGKVFRTIHTIKGTSGVLGFGTLEKVTHVGENLLSRMRDGELIYGQSIATGLLQMVDAVREMLTCIEDEGSDGSESYGALITLLERLNEDSPESSDAIAPEIGADAPEASFDEAPARGKYVIEEPVDTEQGEASTAHAEQEPAEPAVETLDLVHAEIEAAGEVELAPEALPSSKPAGKNSSSLSGSTVRVDVSLLDQLMTQVGELVLARNRIMQYGQQSGDTELQSTVQGLNLITSELQEEVMKTRMQPIGSIWNKFPRAVRDLCVDMGKKVNLVMEGRETELDRTLIEAIKDPLMHALRNSVDHGVELPEARLRAGKSFTGTVKLRAYHEGGQVTIELTDDGGGIDPEKIGNKAVEKNIITKGERRGMSDRELINLVFAPGFSTAAAVTNVSGRGVGMDVVKTNIEKIGGTVEIRSKLGEGTGLKLKIPLTLAIIPALVVDHSGGRYAIPQASLLELLRLEGAQAKEKIERVHGARVYRLRGKLLPLVHLGEVLGQETSLWPGDGTPEDDAERSWNIVVLHADDQTFGLVVDGINDTEEIVVKPLGKQLKSIPVFSGATIMGDGNVALILDILGIGNIANAFSTDGTRSEVSADSSDQSLSESGSTMILVEVGENGRMAMPLSSVSRLEEFEAERIENCAGREVTQYRGHIMPLVRLGDLIGRPGCSANEDELVQVVVRGEGSEAVGIIVDRIIDITETDFNEQDDKGETSTVIDGRVTEIVRTNNVLASAGF
jgi:two-component system chemotaxis sensor kinase CheA